MSWWVFFQTEVDEKHRFGTFQIIAKNLSREDAITLANSKNAILEGENPLHKGAWHVAEDCSEEAMRKYDETQAEKKREEIERRKPVPPPKSVEQELLATCKEIHDGWELAGIPSLSPKQESRLRKAIARAEGKK